MTIIPNEPTLTRGLLGLPGPSDDSRRRVETYLRYDHDQHNIFFNDKGFHNHLSHHLLAALSLGAPPSRLDVIYNHHSSYLLPLPPRIAPITASSWHEHLGDRARYTDYLDFFDELVKKEGVGHVIEKYAMDPEVLHRLVGGVFHPIIHLGNGVEFGWDGVVAQGLAEACVTGAELKDVIEVNGEGDRERGDGEGKCARDLLKALKEDRELDGIVHWGEDGRTETVVQKAADKIKTLVREWGCQENNLTAKLQDLYTTCAYLYAATTPPKHAPKLDFFLLHTLTSSYFLPPLLSLHPHPNLLTTHLAATLTQYVAQGRPTLYTQHLLDYKPSHPRTENPWMGVVDQAIKIDDEHVPKVVRALAQGEKAWGWEDGMWCRAAECSVDVTKWYFDGVGFEEAWK